MMSEYPKTDNTTLAIKYNVTPAYVRMLASRLRVKKERRNVLQSLVARIN